MVSPDSSKIMMPGLSLGLILSVSYFILHDLSWSGNGNLKTSIDMLVTLLGFIVGTLFLVHHYTKKSHLLLCIGIGFIGSGVIEGLNAFADLKITPLALKDLSGEDLSGEDLSGKIISWSSIISFFFLSSMILLGLYLTPNKKLPRKIFFSPKDFFARDINIYGFAFGLALTILLLFAYAPLPFYNSAGRINHWVIEYTPSLISVLCLFFLFRERKQPDKGFSSWLFIFLVINVIGLNVFMVDAQATGDLNHQMANVLKVMSYLHILNYLMIDIYRNQRQTERQSELLLSHDIVMKEEINKRKEMKTKLQQEINCRKFYHSVVNFCNKSKTSEEVIKYFMQEVFRYTGWEVGHYYLRKKENSDIFVTSKIWNIKVQHNFSDFIRITENIELANGFAFSGRAIKTQRPIWCKDIHTLFADFKISDNDDIKVKTGLVVPIIISGDVQFVIEFFTTQNLDRDQKLLSMMEEISVLIALAIERANAVQKLVTLRGNEKSARKSKSTFLSVISHEIRTPMNAVLGMTDLLRETKLTFEQKRFTEIIKQSGEALLNILNDLLDISKLETGKVEVEKVSFNLKGLIHETCSIIGIRAHENGLEISVKIDDSLPRNIVSDPARIRVILFNLLGNAVKFTPAGEIEIIVSQAKQCGAKQQGGCPMIRIEVKDTGIGITEDRQKNLFQKFSQSDTTPARKYGGTGLGLAIAKQLCTLLGGTIGVISQSGRGSNFWFTLEYSIGEEQETMSNNTKNTIKHFNSKRSLKVLVVDDNFINHAILENILREVGHEVFSVETGLTAIEALQKNDFDLIIMDIQMPEMDGTTATRLIRKLPGSRSNIPIVACTADATEENFQDYTRAGMNAMVIKPINKAELLYVINDCLKEEIHFPFVLKKGFVSEFTVHEGPKDNAQVLENLLKEIGG